MRRRWWTSISAGSYRLRGPKRSARRRLLACRPAPIAIAWARVRSPQNGTASGAETRRDLVQALLHRGPGRIHAVLHLGARLLAGSAHLHERLLRRVAARAQALELLPVRFARLLARLLAARAERVELLVPLLQLLLHLRHVLGIGAHGLTPSELGAGFPPAGPR